MRGVEEGEGVHSLEKRSKVCLSGGSTESFDMIVY